jgi:hypothetical protein
MHLLRLISCDVVQLPKGRLSQLLREGPSVDGAGKSRQTDLNALALGYPAQGCYARAATQSSFGELGLAANNPQSAVFMRHTRWHTKKAELEFSPAFLVSELLV